MYAYRLIIDISFKFAFYRESTDQVIIVAGQKKQAAFLI